MLRSGKPLKVYTFEAKDLPKFKEVAKSEKSDNKKSYGDNMREKRDACYAMVMKATMDAMASPDNMNRLLSVMSRFEIYSLNNNLLIFRQMPNAIRLKEFDAWKKDKIGVKQGGKSILILEPHKYMGEDGQERTGYNAKRVFDISMCDAPESAYPVKREYDARKLLSALVHDAPAPIQKSEAVSKKEAAVYHVEKKCICYKPGEKISVIFPALVVALVHARAAKGNEYYRPSENEFAARCVANVLCRKYGIETSMAEIHSVPPKYASAEADEIKSELAFIHGEVKYMTEKMREVLEPDKKKEAEAPEQEDVDREAR